VVAPFGDPQIESFDEPNLSVANEHHRLRPSVNVTQRSKEWMKSEFALKRKISGYIGRGEISKTTFLHTKKKGSKCPATSREHLLRPY
jgi:hypothetical protein